MHALALVDDHRFRGTAPDLDATVAYIEALRSVYDYRIEHIGEGGEDVLPTHTSHLCVADADGNLVSLTQTVMSAFGARIMLPRTGILMNNGMMWFDPRPGRPNSVRGGRRPLCNMLPTVVRRDDGSALALGASGGRKILASVFQLVSFVLDHGMDLDEAVHCARIDVSGNEDVGVMSHMAADIVAALEDRYPTARVFPERRESQPVRVSAGSDAGRRRHPVGRRVRRLPAREGGGSLSGQRFGSPLSAGP